MRIIWRERQNRWSVRVAETVIDRKGRARQNRSKVSETDKGAGAQHSVLLLDSNVHLLMLEYT